VAVLTTAASLALAAETSDTLDIDAIVTIFAERFAARRIRVDAAAPEPFHPLAASLREPLGETRP